jgi:hypothetical protein
MRLAGSIALVDNIVIALSLCHVAALKSGALEGCVAPIQLLGNATVE